MVSIALTILGYDKKVQNIPTSNTSGHNLQLTHNSSLTNYTVWYFLSVLGVAVINIAKLVGGGGCEWRHDSAQCTPVFGKYFW